jgi:phosphoribosylformimino-5-aminoimidazole carboxamide ribotide isomerase
LDQGRADAETCYFGNPVEPALAFQSAGAEWLHVVDLDGAFSGEQANREAIESLVETGMKIELGGGLRTAEAVGWALELGVKRAVVGTRACEEPAFAGELVKTFGAEAIAIGLDAKDGKAAVSGWTRSSGTDAIELAKDLEEKGVQTLIYTDVSRDGMLSGPNFEALERLLNEVNAQVIASGGVGKLADIHTLASLQQQYSNLMGVIVGKALYEKRFSAAELFEALN